MEQSRGMIHVEHEPQLRAPVLVAAFRGWNDAGDAASFAATHLRRAWKAQRFASIDPEEFYDFQAVRPHVRLEDGHTRRIDWPENVFWYASPTEIDRDVILLIGTEPNTRWRTFTGLILDIAERHGVQLVVTLGALLADVPHSRPVHITGTAANERLIRELGLERSRYEGPTGIVGVFHDACANASIDSASLWAAVPHYVAVTPNPKAALALVERTSSLIGLPAETEALRRASGTYEQEVSEMVASDEDVQAYVRLLEQRADERMEQVLDSSQLPSGEALAAELEQFLRQRNTDPEDDA